MNKGTISEEEMKGLLEDYNRVMGFEKAQEAASFNTVHQNKTRPDASAGALANFPQSVQEQIPAEYRTVNEFVTASISENYQNVKSATIQFAFETQYPANEKVYLIFGVMDGNDLEWIVNEAEVLENGSVSVELQKDQLDQLAGKPFPLIVVSRQ